MLVVNIYIQSCGAWRSKPTNVFKLNKTKNVRYNIIIYNRYHNNNVPEFVLKFDNLFCYRYVWYTPSDGFGFTDALL